LRLGRGGTDGGANQDWKTRARADLGRPMRRHHPLLLLATLLLAPLSAGEVLGTLTRNSVTVEISFEPGPAAGQALLVGVFTPKPKDLPLHLYGKDLTGTTGVATRLALKPGQAAEASGPLSADHETHLVEDLPLYPDGPVTLKLPIRLPTSDDGLPVKTTVLVTYMACTAKYCLNPVFDAAIQIDLPSVRKTAGAVAQPFVDSAALRHAVQTALEAERPAQRALVAEAVAKELAKANAEAGSAIRWHRVASVGEIERLMAEARAAGKPALLDFTGPSCVNCQKMDKTVFRLPAVAKAWNQGVPISINTDPDPRITDDLAAWQQKTFATQNRPLYIRIDPDGKQARWSEVFSPSESAKVDSLVAFLGGGAGSDVGSGDGLGQFLVLAILGGLFTLLMPCTYPMIPFTMTFFSKQAAAGHRLLPLATFYAAGIIACFVGLGVLITGVFGSTLSTLAGHPVTNLVIALLFIVLGLGLLGAFLIRLPAGLEDRLGGGRGGYLGALVMGLTFAVTAFSCTAPFAGAVLSQAVATGTWTRAVIGMAVYSGAIAIPFFVLAMSPSLLKRMPRAGAWMNEFKVVGGLVELAAALKFLVICDGAWSWGIVGRSFTLASWSAVSLVIAAYVLGKLRFPGDNQLTEVGVGRVLTGIAFLAIALWLASGLAGNNLGLFESFFPGDPLPGE
jgi:thiol:disulfide interchange protein